MNFGSRSLLLRYVLSGAAVIAVTGGLVAVYERINITTVALSLIIVVLASATFFGRNPALLASFAAMLCFNYFFIPPVHTWAISDSQNLIAWSAFTITAIIAGELSAYARRRAAESEKLYAELQSAFESATQTEALRQSEKLKSALLDAVTHDLRTPLTSIKAAATTLLESEGGHRTIELDGEGRAEFLEIINEEADRLNDFIEGMVELARVEAGSPATAAISSVDEIITLAVARAQAVTAAHLIDLDIESNIPMISVEARSIAEVIYNLIENAAKYSPEGSKITVEAKARVQSVEITVADEGSGIPEEMRERVFEKFVRLNASPRAGLGLGLAIARGIVESQNGTIAIETAEGGRGTRFVLTLPVAGGSTSETTA